ncbi:hypothetical protein PHSY_006035 [Pseudozyma hubeiensis SY62]|uniref:Uncharacterized protein n=1 Tax=Pseudozyma hubeiensis (strain SY62) TaxID=1305764 RepID=R9PAP6_PSEHS|nr:hypothetical protein PHSY_006035 [Pseudozyma hubeiensis SY62]GAC98441.1 hypothetical protein PHSY_006035 [Pseudozyma hubeiensis SY62]
MKRVSSATKVFESVYTWTRRWFGLRGKQQRRRRRSASTSVTLTVHSNRAYCCFGRLPTPLGSRPTGLMSSTQCCIVLFSLGLNLSASLERFDHNEKRNSECDVYRKSNTAIYGGCFGHSTSDRAKP